jgi:hypothetical protein
MGVSPLDFLYDLVAPGSDPRQLRSVATLAALEGFRNKAIWLDEIPDPDWESWLRFFVEFERVSRSVPESRRSCFAVRMSRQSASPSIPTAAGLSVRHWDGWLKRNDMYLYSAGQVQERQTGIETDLATSLVTVLGGWDPDLCEYLAGFELSELLRPAPLLREFAGKRGWTLEEAEFDEQAWRRGLWQTYLGKRQAHTCFAFVLDGSRFLDGLIWRAEIGVLMPFIEEQRQQLIERNRPLLKLPFYTRFGVIDDVYDLEIGMIEFLLGRSGACASTLIQYVGKLREARNLISHLAPVFPDLILDLCKNCEYHRSALRC